MREYSVIDVLLVIAEEGKTSSNFRLNEKQIEELEKSGFVVTKLEQVKKLFCKEWKCLISWEHPTKENSTATRLLWFSLNPPY